MSFSSCIAETFLLFATDRPSHDLGFVDAKAPNVDVQLGSIDVVVEQSARTLESSRQGGTTGAVLWKISPLLGTLLRNPSLPLTAHLSPDTSAVLELGCGISPLNALALGPRVRSYLATDQPYVRKLLLRNVAANVSTVYGSTSSKKRAGQGGTSSHGKVKSGGRGKDRDGTADGDGSDSVANVRFRTLDWEADHVVGPDDGDVRHFDLVLACDCIYNEALVRPFVQTCADACRLNSARYHPSSASSSSSSSFPLPENADMPTVCLIAQQLRSDSVFQAWLEAFHEAFHVWRVPDELVTKGLRPEDGFVLHIGLVR